MTTQNEDVARLITTTHNGVVFRGRYDVVILDDGRYEIRIGNALRFRGETTSDAAREAIKAGY